MKFLIKKVLLIFPVLIILLQTGCWSIEATVGEFIDACSDNTPRTLFYFDIPAALPYEKDTGWLIKRDRGLSEIPADSLTETQIRKYSENGYVRKTALACQIAVLYRRNGKMIWPGEFHIYRRKVGSDFFYAERWTPEYKPNPIAAREEICLIAPDENDEIMVFVTVYSTREIRFFSQKYSDLPDFDGEHYHRIGYFGFYDCILDRGPFLGLSGNRFPHKVIKFPPWEKLTPLVGNDLRFYQEKFFGELKK